MIPVQRIWAAAIGLVVAEEHVGSFSGLAAEDAEINFRQCGLELFGDAWKGSPYEFPHSPLSIKWELAAMAGGILPSFKYCKPDSNSEAGQI